MVRPDRPAANGFVRVARKVYNPLGFSRGYNFVLFFIFAGALMGFTLARFQYLNFNGVFCSGRTGANGAAPGECYWYQFPRYKAGILIHLGAVLPAMFLVCFQFVPAIRHKLIIFHRINGYVIILLTLVANAGALMIARRAFGGRIETQVGVGVLVIITTLGIANAYYNIKKLQIEQHRAWMLRTFFYMGTIITLRIIQIIATLIMSNQGGYYNVTSCDEIFYLLGRDDTIAQYPACNSTTLDPYDIKIPVLADFGGSVDQVGVSLDVNFGMAMWLALALHVIGVEIYLHLTPREHERLRQISYEKQLEAGFKNPGSAGVVAQRFGDANPWSPAEGLAAKTSVVGE